MVWDAVAVFAVFLGAGLHVFLCTVLYPQRRVAPAGPVVWRILLLGLAWNVLRLIASFYRLNLDRPIRYETELEAAALVVLVASWLLCAAMWRLARGRASALFLWSFLPCLVLPAALLAVYGSRSAALAITAMAPPFCLAWFLFWQQTLGLVLSRGSVFALTLGVFAALYLFAVRAVANYAELTFGGMAAFVELALLFWAGLLWIPVYAWTSRLLARRTRVFAEFGKAVIEEASRILDLEKRAEFLGRQIQQRFGFRKVLLLLRADREPELNALASSGGADFYRLNRMEASPAREALDRLGCNYLFPLRYENRLAGLLLLDTHPLESLDDNEPVMAALAPQISQSVESCRLIEEKIALERELARQENLASLGSAAAAIAHEIKNPLSSIKTLVQVMKEDEALAESHGQDLQYIIGEIDRLDRSLRQLLGFSKAAPALDEEVEVSALLASTTAVLARQYGPEGVEVRSQVAAGLVLKHSSCELFQQMILNLLLNAIQASPRPAVVELQASAAQDRIEIAVRDHGPGVPAGLREKVFEPFFTTKPKGTGLGLAIVRKNVRLLGGDVSLDCPPEGGTTVTLRLPVQP